MAEDLTERPNLDSLVVFRMNPSVEHAWFQVVAHVPQEDTVIIRSLSTGDTFQVAWAALSHQMPTEADIKAWQTPPKKESPPQQQQQQQQQQQTEQQHETEFTDGEPMQRWETRMACFILEARLRDDVEPRTLLAAMREVLRTAAHPAGAKLTAKYQVDGTLS